MRLTIHRFDALEDRSKYSRFEAIRRSVFAGELGWSFGVKGVEESLHDPCDRSADLWLAEIAGVQDIGIVRGTRAAVGLPHRELFEDHLLPSRIDVPLEAIGTINSLAVLRPYRRCRFEVEHREPDTASAQLLRTSLAELASAGAMLVLATVLSAISARAFLREGFLFLDHPRTYPAIRGFRLANMASVLRGASPEKQPVMQMGSAGWHSLEQANAYIRRRHEAVLQGSGLDALFE